MRTSDTNMGNSYRYYQYYMDIITISVVEVNLNQNIGFEKIGDISVFRQEI